jgi:uncharacterized protein (TIGR02646 family)
MIPIRSGAIPKELSKHKISLVADDPNYKPTYDNLSKEAKDELKTSLLKEQGYICAYCNKSIDENSMSIEHFCSQSQFDGSIAGKVDLSLDYSNLLAVCENSNQHCDKFRSQQVEKNKEQNKIVQKEFDFLPNPKSSEMGRIKFNYGASSFKIACTNPKIQSELELLLNLNCQILTDNRKKSWNTIVERLQKKNKQLKDWPKSEAVIREAQKIYSEYNLRKSDKYFAYCGFISFMLKKIFGDNIN